MIPALTPQMAVQAIYKYTTLSNQRGFPLLASEIQAIAESLSPDTDERLAIVQVCDWFTNGVQEMRREGVIA